MVLHQTSVQNLVDVIQRKEGGRIIVGKISTKDRDRALLTHTHEKITTSMQQGRREGKSVYFISKKRGGELHRGNAVRPPEFEFYLEGYSQKKSVSWARGGRIRHEGCKGLTFVRKKGSHAFRTVRINWKGESGMPKGDEFSLLKRRGNLEGG